MSDEAPKEMWLSPCADDGWDAPYAGRFKGPYTHSYTLTTHAHALVAEAYDSAFRAAFRACKIAEAGYIDENSRLALRIENELRFEVSKAIKNLTPADAIAAREARDKHVRKQALREALAKTEANDLLRAGDLVLAQSDDLDEAAIPALADLRRAIAKAKGEQADAQADYEHYIRADLHEARIRELEVRDKRVREEALRAAAATALSVDGFVLDAGGNAIGVKSASPQEISDAILAMIEKDKTDE